MPRLASFVSILGVLAVTGLGASTACRTSDPGPAPIRDIDDVVEIQEQVLRYQCECFVLFDDLTPEQCLQDERIAFSDEEIRCLDEVFEGDAIAFEVLRCETEALRGLLACQQADGCPAQVQCDDGTTIPDTWRCDGSEDCLDGSDEGPQCETERCANGDPVAPAFLCDEFPDCIDGSDEVQCPPSFVCDDGQQIPGAWVCNNEVECPDGSDEEQSCPESCERPWIVQRARCGSLRDDIANAVAGCLEFTCLDGQVIESGLRCDGASDCSEGEDEVFCDGEGTSGG